MRTLWKFFCSNKLVLVLLALIILASISGTLIQQNADPEVYLKNSGALFYGVIKFFGLNDIYHSWWFLSLLFLLSMNIVICSVDRFSGVFALVRGSKVIVNDSFIAGQKNFFSFKFQGDIREIQRLFKKNKYNLKSAEVKGQNYFLAEKGVLGRFGSFITHVSIIVILIGAVIGALGGFKDNIQINEGETIAVPHTDIEIRLDKFVVEYYEDSQRPKDYKSSIVVLKADKEMAAKTIEVNDPLNYEGIFFYQSTYGQSGSPESVVIHVDAKSKEKDHDSHCSGVYTLKVGESFTIKDTEYHVKVSEFVSDFYIDKHNHVISRSSELKNPALKLSVHKGKTFLFDVWSFPDFGVAHFPENFDYNFVFQDASFKQFSGLQVVYDPGVWVVWVGCGIMILGLFVSFYVYHRRIWMLAKPVQNGWELSLGGNINKNEYMFKREFEHLVSQLKRV